MTSSDEQRIPDRDLARAGRAYWLPPSGHGNGLDADVWCQIAQVPRAIADPLLWELRMSGIPAWAAPDPPFHEARVETPYDIWIATDRFDSAEDLVMRFLSDSRQRIESRPRLRDVEPDADSRHRRPTNRHRDRPQPTPGGEQVSEQPAEGAEKSDREDNYDPRGDGEHRSHRQW